jgi:hypothetical protein
VHLCVLTPSGSENRRAVGAVTGAVDDCHEGERRNCAREDGVDNLQCPESMGLLRDYECGSVPMERDFEAIYRLWKLQKV